MSFSVNFHKKKAPAVKGNNGGESSMSLIRYLSPFVGEIHVVRLFCRLFTCQIQSGHLGPREIIEDFGWFRCAVLKQFILGSLMRRL